MAKCRCGAELHPGFANEDRCPDCIAADVGHMPNKDDYNSEAMEGLSVDELLSEPISRLDLPVCAVGALDRKRIRRIGDLLNVTEKDLLAMPYIGEETVFKIKKGLKRLFPNPVAQ